MSITGITTTSTYDDGSTLSLVNLRPMNGALCPVTPRKTEQTLSRNYDIVFIHKINDLGNWIGVVAGDTSTVYNDITDSPVPIATVPGEVTGIQQIGNTLSLITAGGVYYLLYRNDAYRFLGELPQVPAIKLKTSDRLVESSRTLGAEYGSGVYDKTDGFSTEIRGLAYKLRDEIVNGYADNGTLVEGQGPHLFDAHFIRYAFRLFDGTLTKHSPPILVLPYTSPFRLASVYFSTGRIISVYVSGYQVEISYDFLLGGDFEVWKDIIQSVDIFMSAPLGFTNLENIRTDLPLRPLPADTANPLLYTVVKDDFDVVGKEIEDASSYYLLKSISLGKASSDWETIPLTECEISDMKNLIYQEVMPDDQLSNHKHGAGASHAYNNRLHLANINTTFFNGFDPGYFLWGNRYNNPSERTSGTGAPGYLGVADTPATLISEVELSIGTSVEKVYSSCDSTSDPYLYGSAFISYPDARATRITIYKEVSADSWEKIFTARLVPHAFLNLAYHINDGLKPVTAKISEITTPPDTLSKKIMISEPDKLKVSELNNPLVFPVRNTYQIGDGKILSMATNVMNVSDRNYGQYPLYIFTTRGVWALNVGQGEVAYSALSAPAYTEAPVSKLVAETPYGVVFAGRRGLMLINGRAVEFLSPQIEETPQVLNIEKNQHCEGVVFEQERRKFAETLTSLRSLVYNPFEDELIIDTGSDLNYVLNFPARSFYQSTERIDEVVGNSYPHLFVVENKTEGAILKDFATAASPHAHVSLITRPLRFGSTDIKRFERMILRGLIHDAKNTGGKFPLYMFHDSMDGVNFRAITGYPVREGNSRDLDSGLLASVKTSHLLFTLAGAMNEETKIYHLDTVLEDEYKNTKMR